MRIIALRCFSVLLCLTMFDYVVSFDWKPYQSTIDHYGPNNFFFHRADLTDPTGDSNCYDLGQFWFEIQACYQDDKGSWWKRTGCVHEDNNTLYTYKVVLSKCVGSKSCSEAVRNGLVVATCSPNTV